MANKTIRVFEEYPPELLKRIHSSLDYSDRVRVDDGDHYWVGSIDKENLCDDPEALQLYRDIDAWLIKQGCAPGEEVILA